MTEEQKNEQIEFNVNNIIGLDIEPEDRDVGIFGNNFNIGFQTENNKNVWLSFGDNELNDLLELLKPHYEKMREWAKNWEEEKEYQKWKERKGDIGII